MTRVRSEKRGRHDLLRICSIFTLYHMLIVMSAERCVKFNGGCGKAYRWCVSVADNASTLAHHVPLRVRHQASQLHNQILFRMTFDDAGNVLPLHCATPVTIKTCASLGKTARGFLFDFIFRKRPQYAVDVIVVV